MKPQKTNDIEAALIKKGFKLKNSHHRFYFLYVNGKKTTIRTRISHGYKEYDTNLLTQMAKQLKLTKEKLIDLIECPLTYKEYIKILKESRLID